MDAKEAINKELIEKLIFDFIENNEDMKKENMFELRNIIEEPSFGIYSEKVGTCLTCAEDEFYYCSNIAQGNPVSVYSGIGNSTELYLGCYDYCITAIEALIKMAVIAKYNNQLIN